MALDSLHIPDQEKLRPVITAIGVGGAGCNAIQNMFNKKLNGVDFVVANTDAQSLDNSEIEKKIQLGPKTTQGLGAGSDPDIGRQSAEESSEDIKKSLEGAHMVFITAGMGGGTGTGAAPVIAKIAKEMEILTIGVVTKPFVFEGGHRLAAAEVGIKELRRQIHTSVVIPNQNLFQVSNEKTTFSEAFMRADDVLYEGVKSITDLMVNPGKINLDFADVRTVLMEMGSAMMGTGEHGGENRAKLAAAHAMTNQLLEENRLHLATAVLINVIGGDDMTLFDMTEASETIRENINSKGGNPNARIIIGSTLDPKYNGKIKVALLAAGLNAEEIRHEVAENLITEIPSAEAIWNSHCEIADNDEDEDSFTAPFEEEFEPTTTEWPHIQDHHKGPVAGEISMSSNPSHENVETTRPATEHLDSETETRSFVAPRPVNGTAAMETNIVTSSSGKEEALHHSGGLDVTESRPSKAGHLRSIIQRMKPGVIPEDDLTRQDDRQFEPSFSQENMASPNDVSDYSEEEAEKRRRFPAFMRRQAN